jgi:hypothetical protein
MSEEWKPVVGFEGAYEVSSMGRVRSLDRLVRCGPDGKGQRHIKGRLLKPRDDGHGYFALDLRAAGQGTKRFPVKVYRLVATAFLGAAPSPDHDANHINGIKTDCRSSNLEWATHAQNMAHAGELGLVRHGETCHLSKLTDEQVIRLRYLYQQGDTLTALATMFNITPPTVWSIVNGKTWKHLLREADCEVSR